MRESLQDVWSGRLVSIQEVERATAAQNSKKQYHTHMETCHHGDLGRKGCRMCMARGYKKVTGPFELEYCRPTEEPTLTDEGGRDSENEIQNNDISEAKDRNEPFVTFAGLDGRLPDGSVAHYKPFPKEVSGVDRESENCEERKTYFYQCTDILDKNTGRKDAALAWETQCWTPDPVIRSRNMGNGQMLSREEIIVDLKASLEVFPEYAPESSFWPWLEQLRSEDLFEFYDRLLVDFIQANAHLASFNVLLSYCTGSHNNVQTLGSMVQAKGV